MNMDLQKLAIAGAIVYAAYKFGPGQVKAGAIAVGAMMVAKRIPYVNEAI